MRSLSSLVQGFYAGQQIQWRMVVRVALASGVYCVSDGPAQFAWNNGITTSGYAFIGSLTYVPLGEGLRITLPSSDSSLNVGEATLQLSATDAQNVLTAFFEETYRNAYTEIALVFWSASTGLPVAEDIKFVGYMDTAKIEDQPLDPKDMTKPIVSTLTVTVTPPTTDLKRSSGRMGNDVDQRLYRDDLDGFFKDVALVGVSNINFGFKGVRSPVQASGGT